MKRYITLYLAFIKFSVSSRLEYRLDFIANALRSLGWFFVAIISFNVLFQQTNTIAGWDKNEALTLFGIFMCINEWWYTLFFMNLTRIPEYVQKGDFDSLLLKPISTQFIATMKFFMIFTLPNALLSFFVILYYSSIVSKKISLGDYILTAFLTFNGLMILYSIMLFFVTLSFWIVRLKAFWEIYGVLTEGARYPVDLFKNPLRFVFIYIIPLAVIFTFPAQNLVKTLSPVYLISSFIIGMIFFWVSHKFFYLGIRHYNSASS